VSPDSLTVEIRARTHWEAIDLGLTLVQSYWRNLYAAWLVAALPVAFPALALIYLLDGSQYGLLLLWWLKPFYDRVLLHVLSRAVFGETVNWHDVLRAMPGLLRRSGLFSALTWGRFTPCRSFKLPIWQLEGVTGRARHRRLHTLKGNGPTRLLIMCGTLEWVLTFGALGLLYMMLPPEFVASRPELLSDFFSADTLPLWFEVLYGLIYLLVISAIEPFYVAAGFSLYLNRRTELEGWDIELGFRTLAARLETRQTPS
jgi:hypothetical protein